MAEIFDHKGQAVKHGRARVNGSHMHYVSAGSNFTPNNISSQFRQQGVWVWHIPFFWIPHLPEMLITGKEREFWEFWIKAETWNPNAITDDAISEWIVRLAALGGLRGCLETHRAGLKNARSNKELQKTKLTLPIMTVGAPEFFGPLVEDQMRKVSAGVERAEVFEECGQQTSTGRIYMTYTRRAALKATTALLACLNAIDPRTGYAIDLY